MEVFGVEFGDVEEVLVVEGEEVEFVGEVGC